MKRFGAGGLILVAFALIMGTPRGTFAQGGFEQISGKAFESAIPTNFYLEGNTIPVDKLHAALLKTPTGARLALAKIDTTGYSSQIQQKYIGMLITEGKVSVCSVALGVGSYGFGLDRTAGKFYVYNQAGEKVGDCAAKKDTALKQPIPLNVALSKEWGARLYLGRYFVELK
jgi:hypothetical protein